MKKVMEKLKTLMSQKTIIIILTCLVTFAMSLQVNTNIKDINEGNNGLVNFLIICNASIKRETFKSIFIFCSVYILLKKRYIENANMYEKSKMPCLLAVLMSISMVIGYSYLKTNTWNLVFGGSVHLVISIFKVVGYYIVFKVMFDYIFNVLFNKIKYKESDKKVFNYIFEKHSFVMPLLIIVICWLPYLICYYPGGLIGDSSNQILQYYGLDIPVNSATNSVKLIDENVKITNHHSVVHTVLLGTCMKIGQTIGNDNLGVFFCTIIQFILLSTTLSYTISFMKKVKINNKIRVFTLLTYALLPVFPFYAIEITKDVIFVSLLIVYIVQLYELLNIEYKISIKKIFIYVLLCLSICLIGNKGIYAIIFSLPFVAIFNKINRKKILVASVIVLVIYKMFTSILLPVLKIPGASVRETLSIPIQQTARYVREHESEVTEEQKEVIDKLLNYENVKKNYNPQFSDPVKNKFNKETDRKDLRNYLKVWIQMFKKHPTTYIQSFINNYYGYLYIEKGVAGYTYDCTVNICNTLNNTGKFNYHYIEQFDDGRKIINQLLIASKNWPIISWITNIAINSWILITMMAYLIHKKKYKYVITLFPSMFLFLICFASPVNSYFRYALPYIFTMPLMFSIFITSINKESHNDVGELKK